MIAFESALLVLGTFLVLSPQLDSHEHHGVMLGTAAGILFGVSDVAIKALTGAVGDMGVAGLLSPWLVTCILASVIAFFASARGLQKGEAVPVITLTSAAANVTAISGGILVFGDPMPSDPVGIVLQSFAFVLVIVAAALTPAPLRATKTAPECERRDRLGEPLGVVRHRRVPEALEVAQLRAGDQALEAAPLARQQDHVLRPPEQQHRAVELAQAERLAALNGVEGRQHAWRVRVQLRLLDHVAGVGPPGLAERRPGEQRAADRVAQERLRRRRAARRPPHAQQHARGPRPAPAGGPGRRARSR